MRLISDQKGSSPGTISFINVMQRKRESGTPMFTPSTESIPSITLPLQIMANTQQVNAAATTRSKTPKICHRFTLRSCLLSQTAVLLDVKYPVFPVAIAPSEEMPYAHTIICSTKKLNASGTAKAVIPAHQRPSRSGTRPTGSE